MLTYTETIIAIACPNCGSSRWRKHGTVSCSIVPFEAECARCGHTPDILTNRRLCPNKEFVFHDKDWNIVRHLVCFECDKEDIEFVMDHGEDVPAKTVEFGFWPNESTWILPGDWTQIEYHTKDFDGNPITEQVLFCSNGCRRKYRMNAYD